MAQKIQKNRRVYNFILIVLLAVLVSSVYTMVLVHIFEKNILEHMVSESTSRTDSMYSGLSDILTEDDFTEINGKEDMDTEQYQTLQRRLNEIRTLNGTRYFYTAKEDADGKLIYLVDGLDSDSADFRNPGDAIEEEMIPYIRQALSGESVYSEDIVDTTWGHIFTACYPARDEDGEIVGAICIEMDMEQTYSFIESKKHIFRRCAAIAILVEAFLMMGGCAFFSRRRKRELEIQKQLEESAREADNANKSKTEFLRRMSHDLRTPLNGIIGMLQIEEKYAEDVEKLKECRKKMNSSAEYLLGLINNVLDISKMEAGTLKLDNKPFRIGDILNAALGVVETNAADNGIAIEGGRTSSYIRHQYLIGSAMLLNRVLMNLASNAIKYNRPGGKVTLYCTEIESDEKTAWFEFVCRDTGLGMSREFQQHAFEPFAQEGKESTTTYSGSGLGLAIVKEIVDLMGGTIQMESEENVGTTFIVRLPFQIDYEEQYTRQQISTQQIPDISGCRALLVEDNDINMEIAKVMLEEQGIVITEAHNGKEAVEIFAASQPGEFDIIFMDVMMPVMDGLEATKQIRAMERADAGKVQIVAMTANAFEEDRQTCLDAGMNIHIGKPVTAKALMEMFAELQTT